MGSETDTYLICVTVTLTISSAILSGTFNTQYMVSYVEEGMLVRNSSHFDGEGNFPCNFTAVKTKNDISKPKHSAYYQNHGNYSNWLKKHKMVSLKSSDNLACQKKVISILIVIHLIHEMQ